MSGTPAIPREATNREYMGTAIRFNSPIGKVLEQLRDGPKTVDEVAASLRVTPNAVRNQLRKLVNSNLAEVSGRRPGVSKPSALYSLTLDGEIQFSTLYLPVLSQFLRIAEGECAGKQLGALMSKTGRALGRRYTKPSGTTRQRVEAAARLLRGFGGIPTVTSHDGVIVIGSAVCPLSALTSEQPAACRILQSLLHEYMGRPTRICCDQGQDPECCFEVKA
jgi:DeoR family transcriptional regulator, suf operon transcriptional repressor